MEEIKEPTFFNVPEVSNMLGISRTEGYKFVKSPDCPFLVLRIGRRFYNWYKSLVQDSFAENENATEECRE